MLRLGPGDVIRLVYSSHDEELGGGCVSLPEMLVTAIARA